MPSVMIAGCAEPRSAALAIPSPAPKNRYQSGPPKMIATCSSAAMALSVPPAMSHFIPLALGNIGPALRASRIGLRPPVASALRAVRLLSDAQAAFGAAEGQVKEADQ